MFSESSSVGGGQTRLKLNSINHRLLRRIAHIGFALKHRRSANAPTPSEIESFRKFFQPDESDESSLGRGRSKSDSPDDFVLTRILGNDLVPRHQLGQTRQNLQFILENEASFPNCEKRWVLNRIVNRTEERTIIKLLESWGQPFIHLLFCEDEYREVCKESPAPKYRDDNSVKGKMAAYRLRNNYVMNNNGARNAALRDGRTRAKWVLPWDGNCFLTKEAWSSIRHAATTSEFIRHIFVPMTRCSNNDDVLDPKFVPRPTEEPQVVFRSDSAVEFNPAFPYGRRPKVELFWHLGFPGPWDLWRDSKWDPPRRPLSEEAYRYATAGWVARIQSGRPELEQQSKQSFLNRGKNRAEAIFAMIDELDSRLGVK